MWQSLACVLVLLVHNAIVSSPLVEGLWLCRWHQFIEEKTTDVNNSFNIVAAEPSPINFFKQIASSIESEILHHVAPQSFSGCS